MLIYKALGRYSYTVEGSCRKYPFRYILIVFDGAEKEIHRELCMSTTEAEWKAKIAANRPASGFQWWGHDANTGWGVHDPHT